MNKNSIIPLSFIVELLNPPMKHLLADTQKLFLEFKEIYSNYNQLTDSITELSSVDKNTQEVKKLIIRNERIVILNDFSSTTLEGFWQTARDVIKKTVMILNIPLFSFRQYTIRFIASPLKEKDSRIFLKKVVSGIKEDELESLGRPFQGFGLRFIFSPSKTEQNEYNIRIESLLKDPGKIFMENQARFITPLQLETNYLSDIKGEISEAYNFLKHNVSGFLEHYNSD